MRAIVCMFKKKLCAYFFEYAHNCTYMHAHAHNVHEYAWICTDYAQMCTYMHKYAQMCVHMHIYKKNFNAPELIAIRSV